MNAENRFGAMPQGSGAVTRSAHLLGKTIAAAACALSLSFFGCSDAKKGTPKVVENPDDKDPGKVASALDDLVKSTKGTGKGVVTGFLTGEGKSVAKGLLKSASNAAGERRLLTHSEIPLSGATVLIFNAEKPTTLADTTLKTDSTGTYTAVLAEGKYFGFAVYLDLETFQLVTTQIPNMNPVKDTLIRMDTAVAIEDVTAPTVVGVYDAAAANSDGVFLVGSVPDKNAKINITFSEPMNRESAKGVVLGKVDTSSSSLSLADTVKNVTMTWSGDSKELTLNVPELSAGLQYAITIPVSLKDLAKNPLEAAYKATFAPVKAAEIEAVAFAVTSTSPEADGSLKPIQNPSVAFNRPVDVFSLVKGAVISPAVVGFWEVVGSRATFIHKAPFEVGKTYKITLPVSVKDLAGKALAGESSLSFKVVDFEGAAKDATGADKAIALTVESMFGAYSAGDLGRFSAAFHANFRMYQGAKIQSKTQFLEKMKADIGERMTLMAGLPAPVFDADSGACKDHTTRWKVGAQGDASAYLWVESYVNPGSTPRVWDKDRKEIDRAKLAWDRTGPRFTYEGKVYGFAPDFSQFSGGINLDASKDNMRFMADLMAKTSTIILEPVKMDHKEVFLVDGGMNVAGDTARLAVKMTSTEKFSRTNFAPQRGCDASTGEHVHYEILKFMLVNDGVRWLVLTIIAPDEEIRAEDFNKTVDVKNEFGGAPVQPIVLVAPVNNRENVAGTDGSVKFEFKGVAHDSVGGYLVGLSEDPRFIGGRPPFGLLLFVKATNKTGANESFTLDAAAKVSAGEASAIMRRAQDLGLPGWERTFFEYTLAKLHNPDSGFAGVYNWKMIAVRDTAAAQFLANGFKPSRYFGESDFGPNRGFFAVKGFPQGTAFQQFENQVFNQPATGGTGPVGYGDMDQDGVPDFMEQKYGSDMRDRNSFPDFRVDTDGDKLCDFLEQKLDPTGKDSLVLKAGDAAKIKEEIAALAKLVPAIMVIDSDGDGFPDDVEEMLGFNPRDPNNNPGSKMRASIPLGVFSGKVQMGSTTNTVSFKLYQDSVKALFVAFTAYFGKDTVVDTSRAEFNDMMGEARMALPLPMNGPDAGRALLLRGRYDANQSLLMGPVDMIPAPAKTGVNFGSGPFVGQFAASGRGEDVSRFLPGGNNTTGPITNPINNQPANPGYRMPPTGTSEGSKVVFEGTKVTLINDFGDTLAVIENAAWRGQPDGSFDLWGERRDGFTNGTKRTEVRGRLYLAGDGWVLDGGVFQSVDSAGTHRDIPGQMCFKAKKEDVVNLTAVPGVRGTMSGWIAQDKTGAGFQGPVTENPTCPAGQICNNPNPNPGGTFAIPFMGGVERFNSSLDMDGIKTGNVFYVSMGGMVLQATKDSNNVAGAKFPWCNQVVLKLQPVALTDTATDAQKAEFDKQRGFLSNMGNALVIALEDQFRPGNLARLEKARDFQGVIHMNVYNVESRPTPMDYGREGMMCPGTNNPTCPAGQVCNNPNGNPPPLFLGTVEVVRTALIASGNQALLQREGNPTPEKIPVEVGTLKKDPTRGQLTVSVTGNPEMVLVFFAADGAGATLMLKDGLPVAGLQPNNNPTCPAGQTCPNPNPIDTTHQNGPLFLQVEVSSVVGALAMNQNRVFVVRDTAGQFLDVGPITLDPTSVKFDETVRAIVGNELGKPDNRVGFLAEGDVKTPKTKDNLAVVLKLKGPPPTGTQTCPTAPNCAPADTTKFPLYTGNNINDVSDAVNRSNDVVKLMLPPPAAPVDVVIDQVLVGQTIRCREKGGEVRIFDFMGDKLDPTKLAISQDGKPIVTMKPLVATNP